MRLSPEIQLYKPLWQYISFTQYGRPLPPARESVRKGIVSLWEILMPGSISTGRRELRSVPPYLLNRAAPPPDRAQIVAALQVALSSWQSAREPKQAVQVIIDVPGSGTERAVTRLARKQGWQLMGPPAPGQILNGGTAWLDQIMENSLTPLVIPRLGKCYLRNQDGLELMSRLLDWLQTTRRRCLITCNSWAWAFLVKALQIDVMLPTPLVLAPFDGARLQFWLPALARRIHKDIFVFRSLDDGRLMFPMADSYSQEASHYATYEKIDRYGDWVGVPYFLKQLAAYSRGMPEIARVLWQQCLQISADVQIDTRAQQEAAADQRYTVWVRPWSQLKLPSVPLSVGTNELFLLHTLLLHGGASADLLGQLLPLSANEVRQILQWLSGTGVVDVEDGVWFVTLPGYPAVHSRLANEGYLVDAF